MFDDLLYLDRADSACRLSDSSSLLTFLHGIKTSECSYEPAANYDVMDFYLLFTALAIAWVMDGINTTSIISTETLGVIFIFIKNIVSAVDGTRVYCQIFKDLLRHSPSQQLPARC